MIFTEVDFTEPEHTREKLGMENKYTKGTYCFFTSRPAPATALEYTLLGSLN